MNEKFISDFLKKIIDNFIFPKYPSLKDVKIITPKEHGLPAIPDNIYYVIFEHPEEINIIEKEAIRDDIDNLWKMSGFSKDNEDLNRPMVEFKRSEK